MNNFFLFSRMEDIPANVPKNGQVKIVNRTWIIVPLHLAQMEVHAKT